MTGAEVIAQDIVTIRADTSEQVAKIGADLRDETMIAKIRIIGKAGGPIESDMAKSSPLPEVTCVDRGHHVSYAIHGRLETEAKPQDFHSAAASLEAA